MHIPEGRGIFPGLSVQENLRMAVRRVGTPDQRRSAIDHAYDLFPRLAERRTQRAGTLSGGEQQMLALARALAVPPKLIIADEMSLGLAPLVVDFVFENIERASQTGVTIVLIEQFIHRALGLASQCVILKQGSVAWTGPSDERPPGGPRPLPRGVRRRHELRGGRGPRRNWSPRNIDAAIAIPSRGPLAWQPIRARILGGIGT